MLRLCFANYAVESLRLCLFELKVCITSAQQNSHLDEVKYDASLKFYARKATNCVEGVNLRHHVKPEEPIELREYAGIRSLINKIRD